MQALLNLQLSLYKQMKISIKDFISKCDQICRKLQIWSHLLKKSLMENFIFCAVQCYNFDSYVQQQLIHICDKLYLHQQILVVFSILQVNQIRARGASRTAATSKMQCFAIIVNGWKPLTIITKRSILVVAVVIDPVARASKESSIHSNLFGISNS